MGTFLFLAFVHGSWHLSAIGVQLLAQTKQIWRVLKSSNPNHLANVLASVAWRCNVQNVFRDSNQQCLKVQENPTQSVPKAPRSTHPPSEGVARSANFLQVRRSIVMYIPLGHFTRYLSQKQMHVLSWQWLPNLTSFTQSQKHPITWVIHHLNQPPRQVFINELKMVWLSCKRRQDTPQKLNTHCNKFKKN